MIGGEAGSDSWIFCPEVVSRVKLETASLKCVESLWKWKACGMEVRWGIIGREELH